LAEEVDKKLTISIEKTERLALPKKPYFTEYVEKISTLNSADLKKFSFLLYRVPQSEDV
jgi:hypothetical protein